MTGGLEHLKITTRFIDERFDSVEGECVIYKTIGTPSIFKLIRRSTSWAKMCSTRLDRCGEYFFYYETQVKRELKGIHICGCRCNERLKAKTHGSTD